jgi:hypothetical protein
MPTSDSHSDHSDLWHGDEERDWAGRELDNAPEPTLADRERWYKRVDRERQQLRSKGSPRP